MLNSYPVPPRRKIHDRGNARARKPRAYAGLTFGFNPRRFTVTAVDFPKPQKVKYIADRPRVPPRAPWNRKVRMSRRKALNPYPLHQAQL